MSTTFHNRFQQFNYPKKPFAFNYFFLPLALSNDWLRAWSQMMSCLSYRTERKVSMTELKNTVHLQSALIEVWVQAFHSSLVLFSYVAKDIGIFVSADKHALKLIRAVGPPSAAQVARAARFFLLSFHEVMFGCRINISLSSAMKKKLKRMVLGFSHPYPTGFWKRLWASVERSLQETCALSSVLWCSRV